MRKILATMALLPLMVSCALTPDYERPELDVPEQYVAPEATGESLANLDWWQLFQDEQIQLLIRTALKENKDLRVALSRIEESRLRLTAVRANQFPFLQVSAFGGRGKESREFVPGANSDDNFTLSGDLTYQVDLWGEFSRATEAAQAQMLATEYAYRNITLSLVSEVARTYLLLRDLDERLQISRRTLETRQDSLRLIQARFDKGTVPELDVYQAQIEVAVADNVTELVFRVLDPPTDPDLEVLRDFAVQHQLQIALQHGGPGSVVPLDTDQVISPLEYSLPAFDVTIRFEATDFVQVNGIVNQAMVSAAIDLLDVQASHRVLDLYCGIGNFSLPLARRAEHVLGIEGELPQVLRSRSNAELNKIENCEFRQADLSAIDGSEGWIKEHWDRVLLDPARSGAESVVANIKAIGPSRIVYVSCHPGTLARDAGALVREHGYVLEAAGIIDMFPHTGHVESIAVFQKD